MKARAPQPASLDLANFDRLARVYRSMELATFGPWLMRCRCAFLGELRTCRNALVLGDGDGRFTARLLRDNSTVAVWAVDASRAMLQALVRNAAAHRRRVRIHQADARQFQSVNLPCDRCDLIVTHFFLDCLTTAEVALLAQRLRGCVTPGARWVVSEFAIPENWFGRLVAQPLIAALYGAFRLLTGLRAGRLPNHRKALTQQGFRLTRERSWLGGLLVSELWEIRP